MTNATTSPASASATGSAPTGTPTPKRTAQFFDRYAHDFDSIYGNSNRGLNGFFNRFFRIGMKLRYLMTLDGCRPLEGRSVLDVGCGPGHFSIALAKRGAGRVVGIDFAPTMLDIAKASAMTNSVETICSFENADFMTKKFDETFDFSVVMGFMDYMLAPRDVIARTLALTNKKAFFSFPKDGGILAWQRKIRYRARCDLYLYTEEQVRDLFRGMKPSWVIQVDSADRDMFVTAQRE